GALSLRPPGPAGKMDRRAPNDQAHLPGPPATPLMPRDTRMAAPVRCGGWFGPAVSGQAYRPREASSLPLQFPTLSRFGQIGEPLRERRRQQLTPGAFVVHRDHLAHLAFFGGGKVEAQRVASAVGGEGDPAGVPPGALDALVGGALFVRELAAVGQPLPVLPFLSNVRAAHEEIGMVSLLRRRDQVSQGRLLAVVELQRLLEVRRQFEPDDLFQLSDLL